MFAFIMQLPPTLAWTNELIKQQLIVEIREFGSFEHAKVYL